MEILRVEHLSKKYDSKFANKDISFRVEHGSIYGLIGKNGAGKTTLLKQIAGCIRSTQGDIVWYDGARIPNIGICMDAERIHKSMTAYEILTYYGNSVTEVGLTEVEDILKLVGLYEERKKRVGKYSAGMKQRMALAIALLGNPEFLILDEPTNGLDPYAVRELRQLLQYLNREKQITMMISSHNLGELTKLATHYGVLAEGKMVCEFSANEIQNMSEADKEEYILKAMESQVW